MRQPRYDTVRVTVEIDANGEKLDYTTETILVVGQSITIETAVAAAEAAAKASILYGLARE
jgi:hypothetical protein